MVEIEKKFPAYFKNFKLPEGAREEFILVYRACRTNAVEKESFLPTFEENDFQAPTELLHDPITYSLSTFEKPKDVKRFTVLRQGDFPPPCKIAIGRTNPIHGLVQRTKERAEKKSKTSHVDWWLYVDAKPYIEFELIDDFDAYLLEIKNKNEEG